MTQPSNTQWSLLEALVRSLNTPAILVAADGETIALANEAFGRLARRAPAALTGTAWRGLVEEGRRELRARFVERARETRQEVDFDDTRMDGAAATHRIVPIAPGGKDVELFLWTTRDLTDDRRIASDLERSEARLKEAQRLAQLGSWELDLASNELRWSDEIFRMFQVDRSKFGASYEAFLAAIHPYDRAAVDEAYKRSLETRTPYSIVHRLRLRDGDVRWVQERCETTYDQDGRPLRSIGTVQDITDRVVVEQELRRTRDLLRLVLDSSPDPIFVKDLEHRFVLVNHAFARTKGVHPDAMLGRPDSDFIPAGVWGGDPAAGLVGTHEDDRAAFAGIDVVNVVRARPHADGTTHTYETFKLPLRDEMGHVYGLLSYLRDVTDWRKADDVQRDSDARFRELLDMLPDAVLINEDGTYSYANPAAAGMLGYDAPADLVGMTVPDVVAPEALAAVLQAQTTSAGPLGPVDRSWRRRDGTTFAVEISVIATKFEGRPARLVVARDASGRKELAARIAQMDRVIAVGTLAAGVGHEINNPLAYIMANLEFATAEVAEVAALAASDSANDGGIALVASRMEELRSALSEALDGAERVRSIVSDLRSFSRGGEEARSRLQVPAVIDAAANLAWNEIRHRARLVKTYGPIPAVYANESRLAQVFLNLLINAAQAIPEGNAQGHEILAVTRTDDAGRAVIEICDTGSGIAPDVVPRIFDPFFTTKPVGVGTGLGLSICQNIVRGLGGEISVESREPQGTTFRVSLPAAPADAEADAPVVAAPGAGRRATVIVVEDEPLVARSLLRGLAQDHDVVAITRGGELLERLARGERFDLVLCDLMMPELSGMDLYQEVVARFPEQRSKFVFLTGGAFTPRARKFLDQVGAPMIEKPFVIGDVRALVRSLVG